jgi:hypothetical protein
MTGERQNCTLNYLADAIRAAQSPCISRRELLYSAGTVGTALALAGCGISNRRSEGSGRTSDLRSVENIRTRMFGEHKFTSELLASDATLAAQLPTARERRLQVLISRVVRDSRTGARTLERSGYRLGAEYYYPASAVKLIAAMQVFPAMIELNKTNDCNITIDTPLYIHPLFAGDALQYGDAQSPTGQITLRRELTKLFVTSDNRAFNRLYDVAGFDRLNHAMHTQGFRSVAVNHRLSDSRAVPRQSDTAKVTFALGGRDISIPARSTLYPVPTNTAPDTLVGTGVMRGNAGITAGPMDFTRRNGMSLIELQDLLITLFAPDVNLGYTPDPAYAHAAPLLQELSSLSPRQSGIAEYNTPDYPDDYVKFLLPGLSKVAPSQEWRICNKIGQAYGFTTENAWITHLPTGRECFVTATIYTNADGILNDDRYEYTTVAEPWMAALGRVVAEQLY